MKAEDLEAAAVGEDRTRPVHEAVQTAHLGDEGVTRSQDEMISIAEDHWDADRQQLIGRDPFDAGASADGHEDRGLHGTVFSVEQAGASGAVLRLK